MNEDKTLYICMRLHRWDNCELKGCPAGSFRGYGDGSVGFMPVFDDVETLEAEYPDAEITKIERIGDLDGNKEKTE